MREHKMAEMLWIVKVVVIVHGACVALRSSAELLVPLSSYKRYTGTNSKLDLNAIL